MHDRPVGCDVALQINNTEEDHGPEYERFLIQHGEYKQTRR